MKVHFLLAALALQKPQCLRARNHPVGDVNHFCGIELYLLGVQPVEMDVVATAKQEDRTQRFKSKVITVSEVAQVKHSWSDVRLLRRVSCW